MSKHMSDADMEAYADMNAKLVRAAAEMTDPAAQDALMILADYAAKRARGRQAWTPLPREPVRGPIRRTVGGWAYRLLAHVRQPRT